MLAPGIVDQETANRILTTCHSGLTALYALDVGADAEDDDDRAAAIADSISSLLAVLNRLMNLDGITVDTEWAIAAMDGALNADGPSRRSKKVNKTSSGGHELFGKTLLARNS
jgi:hypothetical protein